MPEKTRYLEAMDRANRSRTELRRGEYPKGRTKFTVRKVFGFGSLVLGLWFWVFGFGSLDFAVLFLVLCAWFFVLVSRVSCIISLERTIGRAKHG